MCKSYMVWGWVKGKGLDKMEGEKVWKRAGQKGEVSDMMQSNRVMD